MGSSNFIEKNVFAAIVRSILDGIMQLIFWLVVVQRTDAANLNDSSFKSCSCMALS